MPLPTLGEEVSLPSLPSSDTALHCTCLQNHPEGEASTKKHKLPSSASKLGPKLNWCSVCTSVFHSGVKNKKGEERGIKKHRHTSSHLQYICTLQMERSGSYTSVVSMKGQIWVPQALFCMGTVSKYWNGLKYYTSTIHMAPALQLDHKHTSTYTKGHSTFLLVCI